MKFKLFPTTRAAFGLDINSDSFKIVEMGGDRGKAEFLKGYAKVLLPKGAVINDLVADPKTFGHLIKKTLERPDFGRIDTEYMIGSLPESKSFVRVIQIPNLSEAEADNAVAYEAESFIPMPLDQVYLDWQPLGEVLGKLNVLLIASPREFVDKYLAVLDSAGLKPVALEVESQSCVRALIKPGSTETALIADIGAAHTSLIMVENGNLQFTSSIPIAGNSFTESISKALSIAENKAEEVKNKVGMNNTPEYPNLQTLSLPVLRNLAAEMRNIIKFHSEHSSVKVEKIILCGGGAELKGLPENLAREMSESEQQIKVELANPASNFSSTKTVALEAGQSLGFTTAIGLAMRGRKYEIY